MGLMQLSFGFDRERQPSAPRDPAPPHVSPAHVAVVAPELVVASSMAVPAVPRAEPKQTSRPGRLEQRARALRQRLDALATGPLTLTVTDNRRCMVAAKARGRVLALRLHHMFLEADAQTLSDVLAWVQHHEPNAGIRLDAFVTAHRHLIRVLPVERPVSLTPRGRVHDLRAILADVACRYLEPPALEGLDVRITWGKRVTRRRRHSIQLGSYVREDRLIRVHRALDAEWVPTFFVEAVVYHELLHHEIPVECVNGRRRVHTPEFRAREALFERHHEANAFERDHLGQLLRS